MYVSSEHSNFDYWIHSISDSFLRLYSIAHPLLGFRITDWCGNRRRNSRIRLECVELGYRIRSGLECALRSLAFPVFHHVKVRLQN
ncbi:hypothetical protein L1987_21546 [Smallanthus sonchifolius]|uniref:Uncharacterized protein n=1 Tax=Smallanthus sonchifolius TaxID=185202 RepID=A0ACB9IUV7_9ASTR|nr:hypothetical protein L1987_21546 [Smallanthus sonchifolius]